MSTAVELIENGRLPCEIMEIGEGTNELQPIRIAKGLGL